MSEFEQKYEKYEKYEKYVCINMHTFSTMNSRILLFRRKHTVNYYMYLVILTRIY